MAIKTNGFGILLISVLAMPACFGASPRDDEAEDDASACESDADCKGARVCVDGACVDPVPSGGVGNTGGNAGAGNGGAGNGGTTPTGGTPSTTGGAPSGGGGMDGGSAGAPGGSSGEGGSAGAPPDTCTSSSPIRCPSSSSMDICVDGTYETYSCSSACSSLGFATGPCAAGTGCQCGDTTNQECALGAAAFCVCANSIDVACGDSDAVNMYVACHTNDPPDTASVVRCFENYVSGDTVDCESAFTYCL